MGIPAVSYAAGRRFESAPRYHPEGQRLTRRKIELYAMLGAAAGAIILMADVWALRSTLHATQAALAQAQAKAHANQHDAGICRGMVGGQGKPTWRVRI